MRLKLTAFAFAVSLAAGSGSVFSQEDRETQSTFAGSPIQLGSAHASPAETPRTEQPVDAGISSISENLLRELSLWLASEFDLPLVDELPAIEMVPSQAMPSLFRLAVQSYGDLASKAAGAALEGQTSETVLAFYRTDTETIYLPSDWQISDVKGMSILVHEFVHHIQHKAGMRFFCPAEREQVAFKAQQRWLVMHGRSLEEEFGIDALTLLVRTRCLF